MSNMSCCRFQNTLADLRDCYRHIYDDLEDNKFESASRTELIELCQRIVEEME